MFDLKPLADRVLIKRLEAEERTAGGLYIPDAAKEKPQRGRVIEVGPGKMTNDGKCIPVALKAGDIVFIGKYAGTEVDSDHIVVREDEILGIVKSA